MPGGRRQVWQAAERRSMRGRAGLPLRVGCRGFFFFPLRVSGAFFFFFFLSLHQLPSCSNCQSSRLSADSRGGPRPQAPLRRWVRGAGGGSRAGTAERARPRPAGSSAPLLRGWRRCPASRGDEQSPAGTPGGSRAPRCDGAVGKGRGSRPRAGGGVSVRRGTRRSRETARPSAPAPRGLAWGGRGWRRC